MNKKIIWTLALLLTLSSVAVYSSGVDKLEPINDSKQKDNRQEALSSNQNHRFRMLTIWAVILL